MVGKGRVDLESRVSWGLVGSMGSCDLTVRRESWGFGGWAYLVSMRGAAAAAALESAFGLASTAGVDFAADAVVFDKATLAMG